MSWFKAWPFYKDMLLNSTNTSTSNEFGSGSLMCACVVCLFCWMCRKHVLVVAFQWFCFSFIITIWFSQLFLRLSVRYVSSTSCAEMNICCCLYEPVHIFWSHNKCCFDFAQLSRSTIDYEPPKIAHFSGQRVSYGVFFNLPLSWAN